MQDLLQELPIFAKEYVGLAWQSRNNMGRRAGGPLGTGL